MERVSSTLSAPELETIERSNELSGSENGPCHLGVSQELVLSELIRQIPSLTGKEAMPLRQMITNQLRRWNWPNPQLIFRRTKVIEFVSGSSLTIIDFLCRSVSSTDPSGYHPFSQEHSYSSAIILSDIPDTENPDAQPISCLWAPAYDGKDGSTFSREPSNIFPVFKQASGNQNTYDDRLVSSIATMAIEQLYSKHFTEWQPHFRSVDAAIQRACAWGIVGAKSREIEYRLFAASLSCLLNLQMTIALGNSELQGAVETEGNDLCFTLRPIMTIEDVEVGEMTLAVVAYP